MIEEGSKKIYNSKSRIFLAFCFAFILGAGVSSAGYWNKSYLFNFYSFFLFFTVCLIFSFNKRGVRFFLMAAIFFILGVIRFLIFIPDNNQKNLIFYNGQIVSVAGYLTEISTTKSLGDSAVLKSESVNGVKVDGRALVLLPPYEDYSYGQKVRVKCRLEKPSSKNGNSYERYLARQSIFSLCLDPYVVSLPNKDSIGHKIVNTFFNFRKIVNNKISKLWVEPESALMAGILYGERAGFSAEVSDSFNRAGITHIIAISGYNISLLVVIFMSAFLKFGFSRRSALFLVASSIILFVIFSGASASVFRAGIMGILVLLASYFGRLSKVGNVLVFTAALMLLFNPLVLIYDAGFQLSFLSTLGLVYISPLILKVIPWRPENFLGKIYEDGVTTMSAIISTLPLILFQFGRLSLVAPFSNMLVLWVIPHLMWLGFLSLFISFLFLPLAWPFAFLAHFGLLYILSVASFLAKSQLAAVQVNFGATAMLFSYSILIYLTYVGRKNFKI